ncbi:MAG TPA: hypothetical protein VNX18_19305 [Bryobacteraceae bacterium]|nr:hypothetical protein [Bryobacteraceae bacterium]
MRKTSLHWSWRNPAAEKCYRTGVSLHSHTLYSEESLAFVPRYTAGLPIAAHAIAGQAERYKTLTGRDLDFSRAFWRPPLGPREAYDLETKQIEALGLDALVSLSDHDDIQAGSQLAVLEAHQPISVEWTIPFGPSFFHMGVHNLPAEHAPAIMTELESFTAQPVRSRFAELLAWLDGFGQTLIILNHPMWDEARIGVVEHAQLLGRVIERYGEHIHALELNGLRPWKENQRVIWLAEQSGHVLVSGGDRHGLEPNANLNLTNAQSFAEFVAEIRQDRISEVLFMPQYREPLKLRMIETMCDIVRDYPEFPIGRRRWNERVFYRQDDGVVRPLAAIWQRDEPWPVKWFLGGLRAIMSRQVRTALRLALADPQEAGL